MTVGTKIFLAVFAIFIGVLVLYYGVLMPGGTVVPASANANHLPQAPAVSPKSVPGVSLHKPTGPAPALNNSDSAKPADPDRAGLPSESSATTALAANTAADSAGPSPNDANESGTPNSGPLANPSVPLNISDPTRPEVAAADSSGPGAGQGSSNLPAASGDVKTVGSNAHGPTPPGKPTPTVPQHSPATNALGAPSPIRPQPASDPKPTRATPPQTFEYVVKSGDTGSSIAEAWFGDRNKWTLISKANPLVDFKRLQIGQKLRLPAKDAPVESIKEQVAADKTSYTVRPGDTLAKIARELYNDVSKWELIYDANKSTIGSDPADLKPGMKLKLPPGASASSSSKPKST